MSQTINKSELTARIIARTGEDTGVVEKIVEATFEEIYQVFKCEESVTIRNFGNFYVRRERSSWVFRFNPAQKLRKLFGWSSTYKGKV